jgi:hypothetical protein
MENIAASMISIHDVGLLSSTPVARLVFAKDRTTTFLDISYRSTWPG